MPDNSKSTMRSLGEFFGHILKGVRSQPQKRAHTLVSKQVQEERRDEGKVTLRRTIIEEIEVNQKPPRGS